MATCKKTIRLQHPPRYLLVPKRPNTRHVEIALEPSYKPTPPSPRPPRLPFPTRNQLTLPPSLPLLPINKAQRLLHRHAVDRARLVPERHAVALIRHVQDLGPERRADELRARLPRDGLQQRRHRSPVLRVQVGVHLVEDDHRAALRLLEREDEAERAETCSLPLA